jgi:hypothetical protein
LRRRQFWSARGAGRKKSIPNDAKPPTVIDLSRLTPHELELLMKLARSGAIRPAADDGAGTVCDAADLETIEADPA